jgi:Asp-tRNA(Asn)/Glu-tRNA(Gln) amidotransferase A subunit family amidase
MSEPWQLSAWEAARLIEAGDLTVETLIRSCLDRIRDREPNVGAWKFLDEDLALAQVRTAASAAAAGLRGIPIGVKDVFDTADMPTGYGSPAYEGCRQATEASSVALARYLGAVILGKTVTTEFAAVSPGKTRNPHNAAHTPGGSSSGSAAAVASGMIPLALGTQTSGSTIRPASFCGVVGYKPTFGMIDRSGMKTLAGSLDTVGIFARSVRDAALLASSLARRPALLAQAAERGAPRIGFFRTAFWDKAEPASVATMDRTADLLRKQGVTVIDLEAPEPFVNIIEYHRRIMGHEMVAALSHEWLALRDRITEKSRQMIASNAEVTLEEYDEAIQAVPALRAAFTQLFADCDVLLTPAAVGEAPLGLESTGDPTFNCGWTLLRAPCVTVPSGTGPAGLPVGVQIVGSVGQDGRALAAAAMVEEVLRNAGIVSAEPSI